MFVFRITYGEAIEVLRKHYDGVVPNVSMQASNTYIRKERKGEEEKKDKQKGKKERKKRGKKKEKKNGYQDPIPGMGFEPMCAYAHWNLSPTP